MRSEIVRTGVLLGLFAAFGVALVAFTHDHTREQIVRNEHERILRTLNEIVPPEAYDNNPVADAIVVRDEDRLGTERDVTVFRMRQDDEPVAAVLDTVAPDGYGGPIRLLVGIYEDGTVAGVRIVSHQETPGLGDDIESQRSDWIHSFEGRSLDDPEPDRWRVKREGGAFDQFTGATISPRAVVRAVRKSLEYFADNRERLFERPADGAKGLDELPADEPESVLEDQPIPAQE